ncbi:hypothetical protein CN272_20990 [Bacillus anthracis]|nr:hypothetical protein CN272_20990 [Bacillus anthracis]
MLKPDRTVHRFLISSPTRLVGEYISEDLVITHAWSSDPIIEHAIEGPFSRSYYMISIKQENTMGLVGFVSRIEIEPIIVYLSVLFGKRFDYHGPVQESGIFHVPNLGEQGHTKQFKQGFINHHPRANLSVPLNLENFQIMRPLLANSEIISIFTAAGKFYLRALQTYETNPGNAYLDLITCGEILSNYFNFDDEKMYDEDLLKMFKKIEEQMDDGTSVVKNIKQRLYQVKRRFTFTILDLLTPDFFEANEINEEHGTHASLTPDTIEKRIKVAYDLRSMYVHTGVQFGREISVPDNEVPTGTWVTLEGKEEKTLLKALNNAPTFKGLERIMRFCLLQFLQTNNIINLTELSQTEEPSDTETEI